MFPKSYFCRFYFTPYYWPPVPAARGSYGPRIVKRGSRTDLRPRRVRGATPTKLLRGHR